MQSKWGTYPWFIEHGLDKIHTDDLDGFKKEANNCKVFECVNEDTQFITLKYGEKFFRVKSDIFKNVPMPKFHIGQKVSIINNSGADVVISDIMWHYDKKEHYYFITVNGKKKTKRYFETEIGLSFEDRYKKRLEQSDE